jgi:hypothetical protein
MGEMEVNIRDNYGREFHYDIFTGPGFYDCSIGTSAIFEAINSNLRIIEEKDIEKILVTKKLIKDLSLVNLNINSLVGKFYDNNGYIYYNIDYEIYRFYLKINYFRKLYKKSENKINSI